MSDDEAAFIARIRESPADDTPRLVYADWLDERGGPGDGERAEFIRESIATFRAVCQFGPDCTCDNADCPKCGREYANRRKHLWAELWAEGRNVLYGGRQWLPVGFWESEWQWDDRGFVEAVTCPAATWLAHGDAVLARHPVTKVTLTDHPGWPDEESVGGLPPGVARYRIAGRPVEGPPGGDLSALFPLRWPGVAFELPPFIAGLPDSRVTFNEMVGGLLNDMAARVHVPPHLFRGPTG